jgi:hypothetical protein
MTHQLEVQSNKVWQLVSDAKTLTTYRDALLLTWKILIESLRLTWLILCLALVAGDWCWRTLFESIRSYRAWLRELERPSPELFFKEAKYALLTAGQTNFVELVNNARSQLGMELLEIKPPALPSHKPKELAIPMPSPPTPQTGAEDEPS